MSGRDQEARDKASRPQGFIVPTLDTCFSVSRYVDTWPEALEAEWDALVGESNADPLFMGWAWQSCWWLTWGEALGLKLNLLCVRDPQGQLLAIAPFYKTIRFTRAGLPLRTLQLVGNCFPFRDTVRTEYQELIVRRGFEDHLIPLLFGALDADTDWDELLLRDMRADCATHQWLGAHHRQLGYLSQVATDTGVRVRAEGPFVDYLQQLGKNTRLKMFNRRKLLSELGASFSLLSDPSSALDRLNQLHTTRWGRACFRGPSMAFHRCLVGRLECQFSLLSAGEKDLSVLYDIKVGDRTYNLQCGFDDAFHPKLSLGTLHLGYALERAFDNPGLTAYDLLIGSGKKTFYKQHFQGELTTFVSLRLLRSRSLHWLYRGVVMGARCRAWWPKVKR